MIRNLLRGTAGLVRSLVGTNGVATSVAAMDAKLDALAESCRELQNVVLRVGALDAKFDALADDCRELQNVALRVVAMDAKLDALAEGCRELQNVVLRVAEAADSEGPGTTKSIAHPVLDINVLLHQSRSALMRDMPPGARRLLSAGCAGEWYFDWIEATYGRVEEHIGIEYYMPKPDDLPDNVTWIANTAGNMEAVPTGCCDLVISGQNIEHLWPEETAAFLLEAARVLRSGGTLSIDSPNRALTAPLFWSHPEHTIELTVIEMRQLFDAAGFEVIKEAGIWLCEDPRTGRLLSFDPNVSDDDWSVAERLISGRDKPEHSFIWWLEGRRLQREPDRVAVTKLLKNIFDQAWPERTQRLQVPRGYRSERREDGEWIRVEPGMSGVVFFGPYMPLRAGRYRIEFDLVPDSDAQAACARCEMTTGSEAEVVQFREAQPDARRVTLDVTLAELAFGCQFRCISLGRAGFTVRRHVDVQEVRL